MAVAAQGQTYIPANVSAVRLSTAMVFPDHGTTLSKGGSHVVHETRFDSRLTVMHVAGIRTGTD